MSYLPPHARVVEDPTALSPMGDRTSARKVCVCLFYCSSAHAGLAAVGRRETHAATRGAARALGALAAGAGRMGVGRRLRHGGAPARQPGAVAASAALLGTGTHRGGGTRGTPDEPAGPAHGSGGLGAPAPETALTSS